MDANAETLTDTLSLRGRLPQDGSERQAAKKLAGVSAIAAAFQVARRPESPRPCLFEWRHLRVEEEIGEGGFGKVYRAWDPTLRRSVALKLVREDLTSGPQEDLLMAEARRMARVRHPNILAIHGADRADGRTGIWSDLLEGATLHDRGPASDQILDAAIALTDAVALIHRRGDTHGDIKPGNVMMLPDGTPVLMDFGVVQGELGGGTRFGSPLAMAPEQFDGAPPSPSTDMYALGVVIYFALTRQYPLSAPSLDELAGKHAQGEHISTRALPRPWRRPLRQLLSPDPQDRPGADALKEKLVAIKTARSRRRRQVAVGVVCGSLLLTAVATGWAYRSAISGQQRIEAVKDVLVDAVDASLPQRQSGPASLLTLYEYLADHIDDRLRRYPQALAEMRVVVGHGFRQLGETQKGLDAMRAGIELLRESGSTLARAEAWLGLSSLLKDAEDHEGSADAAHSALALLNNERGQDALFVRLDALHQLAAIHSHRGDWHEYAAAHRQVIEQKLASGHPDLAADYHNLASAQVSIGEYDNAIANERQAAELVTADGQGESVVMGFIMQTVAAAQVGAGRFDDANQSIERARTLLRASLPARHQRLQSLAVLQAVIQLRTGDAEGALRGLAGLYEGGALHEIAELQAQRCRGEALIAVGRWDEAHQVFAELLTHSSPRYKNFRPFLRAGRDYAAYHAGLTEGDPNEFISSAVQALRDAGYGNVDLVPVLEDWRRTAATSVQIQG